MRGRASRGLGRSSATPPSRSRSPSRPRGLPDGRSPGSGSGRGRRDRHDRRGAFRPAGPLHARRRPCRRRRGGRGRAARRRDTANAAHRRSLTSSGRPDAGSTRAAPADGRAAGARRRRAVCGRDPRRPRRAPTSTPSRRRSGCAGRSRPARSTSREPERLRVTQPSVVLAGPRTSRRLVRRRKDGARRFDSGWIPAPALVGLDASLGVQPGVAIRAGRRGGGALPRAARAARGDRDAAGAVDARLVPSAGRSDRARRARSPSAA